MFLLQNTLHLCFVWDTCFFLISKKFNSYNPAVHFRKILWISVFYFLPNFKVYGGLHLFSPKIASSFLSCTFHHLSLFLLDILHQKKVKVRIFSNISSREWNWVSVDLSNSTVKLCDGKVFDWMTGGFGPKTRYIGCSCRYTFEKKGSYIDIRGFVGSSIIDKSADL